MSEEKYKKRLKVFKILDNITRVRILLILLIFRRLSLSKLSKLIGVAKTTISYHIEKFVEINVVKEDQPESSSYINPKYYEISPNFFEEIATDVEEIKDLVSKEEEEIFIHLLKSSKLLFEVMRTIFFQVQNYYQSILDISQSSETGSMKSGIDHYLKNPIRYSAWFLSDKAKDKYAELVINFRNELDNLVLEDVKINKEDPKSNFVYLLELPLQKIIEIKGSKKKGR